ncbi:MAG: Fe-S cluster assembly sulfur transfer protein SufU, partial [Gemmatimonadaceae bacterium]
GALYQDVILEHNRNPRNFRELADASASAAGRNPMCGDEVTVWLKIEDDRIADVSFVGSGCAISKASASMMTHAVKGKTVTEAKEVFEHFHAMVTGKHADPSKDATLGKLKVFSGVARFPTRVKCASLAWHAMSEAIAEGITGGIAGDIVDAAPTDESR